MNPRVCVLVAMTAAAALACDTSVPSATPAGSSVASATLASAQPTSRPPLPSITPSAAPTSPTGWVATAALHQGRSDHTATLLWGGGVLVAGGEQGIITPDGEDQGQDLSSVEIYYFDSDPDDGVGVYTWGAARPMPQPRSGHEAVLLEDGRIFVFGGTHVETFPYAKPVENGAIYDPVTDSWKVVDGPALAVPGGAVLLQDGRVLTVGLNSGTDPTAQRVAIFDPATRTWQRGREHPDPVVFPAVTLLDDGSVLVAGGMQPSDEEPSPRADSWRYDPIADRWQRTGDLIEPALGGPAVRLGDGRVLLVSLRTSNVFDPATDRWTTVAAPPHDRSFSKITGLVDGRVLATGASSCSADGDATDIYDPVRDQWQILEDVPERGGATLTLLADGRAMLAGGVLECGDVNGDRVALRDVAILDPATIH